MEAATLQKKKIKFSKGKLKKTIKNIISRPDPLHWPEVSDKEAQEIKQTLSKHKVEIQQFVKPHWTTIKHLPKAERPRPPKIQKVEGMIFGITACSQALPNNTCQVVILEANITPRMMAHHIVELCTSFSIPLVCLKELKSICKEYFGFPTSCMALQKHDARVAWTGELISRIAEKYAKKVKSEVNISDYMESEDIQPDQPKKITTNDTVPFTYLFRNSKETRIFIPPSENVAVDLKKSFSGENYIKFPINKQLNKKPFMNMSVKKVSNNPNRKRKK